MKKKVVVICVVLLFLFFIIPKARGDTIQYDLSSDKYYHVNAEDNEDGWIGYRKIDDEFTTLFQYDSKDDINANDTTSLILEFEVTTVTKFGWSIQWVGNETVYSFILKNTNGEIFIDESYSPEDVLEKHFTMRLDSPSYRRDVEDEDSKVVIELLDIISETQAEFQLYDRYGEKTRWENREYFNLSDTMKFTLENCDTTEKFANCTVSTTTTQLNSTVWSAWDKKSDDSTPDSSEGKPKFNVSYDPREPTTYEWITITLLDELFFDSFEIYSVVGEGGYETGLNTTTTVEIMFYSQGSKTITLLGAYNNGTRFLSEHQITISGEGTPPTDDDSGTYTSESTDYGLVAAIGGVVVIGAYIIGQAIIRINPYKTRPKYVDVESFRDNVSRPPLPSELPDLADEEVSERMPSPYYELEKRGDRRDESN